MDQVQTPEGIATVSGAAIGTVAGGWAGVEVKGAIRTKFDKEISTKLNQWEYRPDEDLYNEYKEVFDNPQYYNQETGAINWPDNRGFEGDSVTEVLQPGTRLDRYGRSEGTFVSPEGTSYTERALPPGSAQKPYRVYEVVQPVEVQSGKIKSWFGEKGGGIQYEFDRSIADLLDDQIIKEVK